MKRLIGQVDCRLLILSIWLVTCLLSLTYFGIPIYAMGESQPLVVKKGHSKAVRSVAFSHDGKTFASAGADNTLKLWDTTTFELVRSIEGPVGTTFLLMSQKTVPEVYGGFNSVDFSCDDNLIAAGNDDYTVRVYDSHTGTERLKLFLYNYEDECNYNLLNFMEQPFFDEKSSVNAAKFRSDGRTLVSSSAKTLKLWDITTGKLLHRKAKTEYGVNPMVLSPDGRTAASGGISGTIGNPKGHVEIWDITSGSLVRSSAAHKNYVKALAFSPDGRTLASGSVDKTVKLWDVASGTLLQTFADHEDYVNTVAFSPDGRYVASGSSDSTIRIYQADTGALVNIFGSSDTLEQESVLSIAFSRNGKLIASGYPDGTIKIWSMPPKQPVP